MANGRGAPEKASDQRERLLQFRAGARTGSRAVAGMAGYFAWARSAVNGKRPTGAVTAVPRGSANRERRRRRRVAGSFRRRGVCRVVILILVFLLTH